ncbi:MAG TPA: polysaccharide deacetylase family protein, partial [Acidimicrobiales bacterium]|nr:polysaccharide deacetylase family protein [Acidimicrobiales bacterium]
MSSPGPVVCVTIDVEDFFDGMAVLGEQVARRPRPDRALAPLLERLESQPTKPKVTLFVVGDTATAARHDLAAFAAAGHEIASHGPDHGRLPTGGLVPWLRQGREMLEDLLGLTVRGFRSPRFDVPGERGLAGYRHDLAEAGFHYVSDTQQLGPGAPVRELPVLTWRGVRVGGGSYQRLMPTGAVIAAARHRPGP